jgi:hypothetical protein
MCLCAGLAFAGSEPVVSISALKIVEKATNDQFPSVGDEPWEPLGAARGTYLPGCGAVFTFEMSLINVMPMGPFRPEYTAKELQSIHDRKIKKLVVLKSAVRDLLVKAAASLSAMPPGEQITFEIFVDSWGFENRTGLPRRLTMTASRQKLLDAGARHTTPEEMASMIAEQEE